MNSYCWNFATTRLRTNQEWSMHTQEKIDYFSRPVKKKNKVKLVPAILHSTYDVNTRLTGSIHTCCISDQHVTDQFFCLQFVYYPVDFSQTYNTNHLVEPEQIRIQLSMTSAHKDLIILPDKVLFWHKMVPNWGRICKHWEAVKQNGHSSILCPCT